jgi:ATP synthase F1 delta subunit
MKKRSKKSKRVMEGLLSYLEETGEEKLLPEVTKTLEEEVEKSKRKEEIVITSVIELSDDQKNALKTILDKNLGKALPIVNKIDKSLLGGFTIRVKDWFYDASIIRQLESLKRMLLT